MLSQNWKQPVISGLPTLAKSTRRAIQGRTPNLRFAELKVFQVLDYVTTDAETWGASDP